MSQSPANTATTDTITIIPSASMDAVCPENKKPPGMGRSDKSEKIVFSRKDDESMQFPIFFHAIYSPCEQIECAFKEIKSEYFPVDIPLRLYHFDF